MNSKLSHVLLTHSITTMCSRSEDISRRECKSLNQVPTLCFCTVNFLFNGVRAFGGGPFCNYLYQMDLEKLEVSLLPSRGQVPSNRDKTSLFYYNDALYLFGGWSYQFAKIQPKAKFQSHQSYGPLGWNNEFYCYNLVTREWRYQDLKGEFPPPTAASDFARVGDKVYLVAGVRLNCINIQIFTYCNLDPIYRQKPSDKSGRCVHIKPSNDGMETFL